MSTQHTPEPWRVEPKDYLGEVWIVTDSERWGELSLAAVREGCDEAAELGDRHSNARRIVACVNACADMSDDELEDHGIGGLKQWMDDTDETLKAVCDALEDVDYSGRCEQGIYALKQQRDELRAEAEKYHTQLIECKHRWDAMKQQRDELQAKYDELMNEMEKAHGDITDGKYGWASERLFVAIAKHRGQA